MKLIILFFCVMTHAHALTLSQDKSSSDGNSHQELNISNGKMILIKRSNFFDEKKDYRLGTFKTNNKNADSLESRLKLILINIEHSEKLLSEHGSHFNDLTSKNNHKAYFTLDKFRIGEEAVAFKELEAIFKEARQMSWELTNGVIFSTDLKTKTLVRDGKTLKPQPFQSRFYCKSPKAPTICSEKDLGILFVEN